MVVVSDGAASIVICRLCSWHVMHTSSKVDIFVCCPIATPLSSSSSRLTPSPPSCAGGIRRAIAVPNAGGWERLFLGDPSPAAFGGTGARPSVLRTSGVGAAQRASHVWDGCRPGSLLLSVLYAV